MDARRNAGRRARGADDDNGPGDENEEYHGNRVESTCLAVSIPQPMTSERVMASWAFFEKIGRPKRHCAPMVEQSELPFRMLCRKYGADCCFTPMFHSRLFSTDPFYRARNFTTCPEDRPLVVQFCANDPDVFLTAANMVVGECDAVDLNLGCPQRIARRGYYGSFLQENMQLIFDLIHKMYLSLSVPITAKIRILDTEEETLQYAKMVEAAGAAILTVHGRRRDQKGDNAGPANWDMVRKVKEALRIPVIANGSVETHESIAKCEGETGVDGVMSATGLLRNPLLFSGVKMKEVDVALEYLALVDQYPVKCGIARTHLYKLLSNTLATYPELTPVVAGARTLEDMKLVLEGFREKGLDEFYNTDSCEQMWKLKSRDKTRVVLEADKLTKDDDEIVQPMGFGEEF